VVVQREAFDMTETASLRAAAAEVLGRAEKARRVAVEAERLAASIQTEAQRALERSNGSFAGRGTAHQTDTALFLQAVFVATEAGHLAKQHKGEWLLGRCDCLEVARITVEAAEAALPNGYAVDC
jgi:hypothetical protein